VYGGTQGIILGKSYHAAGGDEPFLAKLEQDALTPLDISIEIRPGDAANRVDLRLRGGIPVAILSDADFDATAVDPAGVCFGDAEAPAERDCTAAGWRVTDANYDRRSDLVLRFDTPQTGIDAGDTRACLGGRTADGTAFQGCAPILTEPGGGRALSFAPAADAYVHRGAPRRNFGSEPTLEVDGSPVQQAFLRFEVAGLGAARVSSAVLRLYVTNPSIESGGAVAQTSTADWGELALTYRTRPSIQQAALDELGPVRAGFWQELDVTAAVAGDGALGLTLTSEHAYGAGYSSREGAHPPELVVTTAP
jgi:hypothetical protein